MANLLSGTRQPTRSCSVGSSRAQKAETHLRLTRHRSNSDAIYTNGNNFFSCPDLADARRDLPPRKPNTPQEFHPKLKASASLCEGQPPVITSTRQGAVGAYSRYCQSPTNRNPPPPERVPSGGDRCPSRGSMVANNAADTIRKLSSVSSCRSSSEVDSISFDEELDLSKVVPEIRIDLSPMGSPIVPFKDQNIVEILDFLFVGDIEAACREPLLCRLNIEYLVDVSNLTPQQMRRQIKLKDCPCLCPSERKHTRKRLTVIIDNAHTEDIGLYFDEVNSFIEGARKTGNKVLVFCRNGQTVSPTLVIQYLMKTLSWNLKQAYTFVKSRQTDISTPNGYKRALMSLERRLIPQTAVSVADVFGADSTGDLSRYGRTPLAWT